MAGSSTKTIGEIKNDPTSEPGSNLLGTAKRLKNLKEKQEKQQQEINEVNQTMKYVVLVLLIMVGAMIFSLQIAIWQTKQSDEKQIIYINVPDVKIEESNN